METFNTFVAWKQTRIGLLISGVVEAILAYIFASLAVDTGNLWTYALAIIFSVGTVVSLVKAVKPHGKD